MTKKSTSKARKRVARKKIKQITYGITDSLMNVLLYSLYVSFSIKGGRGPAGVNYGFNQANQLIGEFHASKIRNALYNLRQKGFIKTLRGEITSARITEAGLKRLTSNFPFYDEKRAWDKNIYVVTYDIPVQSNRSRDILRENLKTLKAKKLQDSVYLTTYNPHGVVERITEHYNIQGHILISTLDTYNAFGTATNIKDVLWDLYGLEDLNQKYDVFIYRYKNLSPKTIQHEGQKLKIAFKYLAILEDDPQLPFDLLPDKYLGDEAYLIFQKLTGVKF